MDLPRKRNPEPALVAADNAYGALAEAHIIQAGITLMTCRHDLGRTDGPHRSWRSVSMALHGPEGSTR